MTKRSATARSGTSIQMTYRVASIEIGPIAPQYRCRAVRKSPSGWSWLTLSQEMMPAGIAVGDLVEVRGVEHRRRMLMVFPTVERTVSQVRRA